MRMNRSNKLRINISVMIHVLIIAACSGIFVALAILSESAALPLDRLLLSFAAERRNELLDMFFYVVTWAGSFYILGPVTIIAIFLLVHKHLYTAAALLGIGFSGAALLCHIVKYYIERPRPDLYPQLVEITREPAFPSGHVTQITAFSLSILLLSRFLGSSWRLTVCILLSILTLLVALSRIYLQVHYPSDVLGGLLLAIAWVIAIHMILNPGKSAGQIMSGTGNDC